MFKFQQMSIFTLTVHLAIHVMWIKDTKNIINPINLLRFCWKKSLNAICVSVIFRNRLRINVFFMLFLSSDLITIRSSAIFYDSYFVIWFMTYDAIYRVTPQNETVKHLFKSFHTYVFYNGKKFFPYPFGTNAI